MKSTRIPPPSRSRLALCTAMCLATLATAACGASAYQDSYSAGSQSARWQDVRLAGGLTLRMPGLPELEESEEADFDGTMIRSTVGRLTTGQMLIGFSVTSARGGFIQDPYERASDVATDSSDSWKTRWEKEYEKDGFQAADRILDNQEVGASLRLHFVQGKDTLYTLFAVYPTDREDSSLKWIDSYLASARYPRKQASLPTTRGGRFSLSRWDFVYPPGRDFAVEMPGAPSGSNPSAHFQSLESDTHIYSVADSAGKVGYQVLVHEFGGGVPDEALAKVRAKTQTGYKLLEEEYVHQRGFSGVDARLESSSHHLQARYFLTEDRLYEVLSWAPSAVAADHRDARNRFFRSFRIL